MNDEKATTIERAAKDRDNPYGMLRRATFDGSPLTFEERGVLAYILMKPDNWQANVKDLMREGGIGRDKVYVIINGLIAKGYAERIEDRDGKGHFMGTRIRIYEKPLPGKPDTARPDTARPDTEKPEHNNKGSKIITDPEIITDQTNSVTPSREKPLTPHQEMFGAICEAVGYDHEALSKRSKGEVGDAASILRKAGYTVEDVHSFMIDIWFKDWRWTKHEQYPTIKSLCEGIGQLRSMIKNVAPKKEKKGMDRYREMAQELGLTYEERN